MKRVRLRRRLDMASKRKLILGSLAKTHSTKAAVLPSSVFSDSPPPTRLRTLDDTLQLLEFAKDVCIRAPHFTTTASVLIKAASTAADIIQQSVLEAKLEELEAMTIDQAD